MVDGMYCIKFRDLARIWRLELTYLTYLTAVAWDGLADMASPDSVLRYAE